MSDQELALRYFPFFYSDEKEPFSIKYIGYSILHSQCPSPSFHRTIEIPNGVECVIEYAVYFDFDIQHMYDLEHVWIYISAEGTVVDAESSAHGGYINCYRLAGELIDGTRMPLYFQPGKHAIMPQPEMFKLYSNYISCCMQEAGTDGLLVPDMLRQTMKKEDAIDEAVNDYIQKNFCFHPTLQYQPSPMENVIFYPMEELLEQIPKSIEKILSHVFAVARSER